MESSIAVSWLKLRSELTNPYSAEICLYKPWRPKGFFIWNYHKCLKQLFPLHLNTYMLWVYGHYNFFNSFSVGIIFICQNLAYVDVRFCCIKTHPALKGLNCIERRCCAENSAALDRSSNCKHRLCGVSIHTSIGNWGWLKCLFQWIFRRHGGRVTVWTTHWSRLNSVTLPKYQMSPRLNAIKWWGHCRRYWPSIQPSPGSHNVRRLVVLMMGHSRRH